MSTADVNFDRFRIDDQALAEYDEQGFWISPRLFDDNEVDEIRTAVMRLIQGERDTDATHCKSPLPPFNPGSRNLIQLQYGWWVIDKLREMVRHPGIGYMACQFMKSDGTTMLQDQALYKPGLGLQAPVTVDGNVGWHQDAAHLALFHTQTFCSAWIALQDTNADNGGMRFIVGSHKWGFDETATNFSNPDLDGIKARYTSAGHEWVEYQSVLNAGQVSFHTGLTLHGSGPNLTDRPRISFVMNMMPKGTTYDGQGRQNNIGAMLGPNARTGDIVEDPLFPTMWPSQHS